MYTLRKITEESTFNRALGNVYHVVKKEFNENNFIHYYKSVFYSGKDNTDLITKEALDSKVVSFVISSDCIPIYEDEMVYIMNESGKTFERVNKPMR